MDMRLFAYKKVCSDANLLKAAPCSFLAAQTGNNHSETTLLKSLFDLLAYAYFLLTLIS